MNLSGHFIKLMGKDLGNVSKQPVVVDVGMLYSKAVCHHLLTTHMMAIHMLTPLVLLVDGLIRS